MQGQQGIMNPSDKLRVLCVPGSSAGATPMFAKRFIANLPDLFIRQVIVSALVPPIFQSVALLAEVLVSRVDMVIGYQSAKGSFFRAKSAKLSETAYHELTHAGHYAKVGDAWYGNFVSAEINQIIANFGGQNSPYGPATSADAPIIALGESWAYHMEHFLTNARYGAQSPLFIEQGQPYTNNNPVGMLSSNYNLLEDFSPIRNNDPFRWIPQGLFYDMIDDRNDRAASGGITLYPIDLVLGYNNQQFFNALASDIFSLPIYRERLITLNPNNQTTDIRSLFSFYGY